MFAKAAKASNSTAQTQKNPATTSGAQYATGYWHTKMTRAEVAYVERIARHEAKNGQNYIDGENKWLYNTRSGTAYFALYSTAHEDNPTVLYASKNQTAKNDYQYFAEALELIKKEGNRNGSFDRSATIVDAIFSIFENGKLNDTIHSGRVVGRGSNAGNASVYPGNARNRPGKALLNCLENIEKVRERRDGINLSDQAGKSGRQAQFSFASNVRQDQFHTNAAASNDTTIQMHYFASNKNRKDGNDCELL